MGICLDVDESLGSTTLEIVVIGRDSIEVKLFVVFSEFFFGSAQSLIGGVDIVTRLIQLFAIEVDSMPTLLAVVNELLGSTSQSPLGTLGVLRRGHLIRPG